MPENTTLSVPFSVTADAAVMGAAYMLSSDNATLLPAGSLSLSGAGNSLTLSISPALGQFGSATVTIKIGNASTSSS